jgi:ABC-type multidrug transport system fused ATPase/permease subunit
VILTGMRISMGIAWLVIVAAEMLVGNLGIGYFVWNEWNNLSLANVIFAILAIGVVGMILDLSSALLQAPWRTWNERQRHSSGARAREVLRRRDDAVFEYVAFEHRARRVRCVIGHSGCGKTTILNILAGSTRPARAR